MVSTHHIDFLFQSVLHSPVWMAGTVTGKVCVVDLQFQKSFTYWQCQSYRTYWQYQNLFGSCKNLSPYVIINNNWKLQKTFSPINMPSFVTAPTVASTTTWRRTSRWSCFRYSTCLKIFTSLSSSRSEAFCKSTGAGGEKRVGGGGVARRCSSTQPRSPFGINCTSWETRPSILCVTHQISRKTRNDSVGWTVPYEMMNYKWYLMVLGQYMTILAGTWSV